MKDMMVTVAGNLTANPQQHFGHASGRPFTTFRLAHNRGHFSKDTGQWVQTGTDFLKVIAFGNLGLNVRESMHKGDPVVVHGRLTLREWTQGEKSGIDTEISASTVGWDLNCGQGSFSRVRRPTVPGVDPADDQSVRAAMQEMDQDVVPEPPEEDYPAAVGHEPVGDYQAGEDPAGDDPAGDQGYAEQAAS